MIQRPVILRTKNANINNSAIEELQAPGFKSNYAAETPGQRVEEKEQPRAEVAAAEAQAIHLRCRPPNGRISRNGLRRRQEARPQTFKPVARHCRPSHTPVNALRRNMQREGRQPYEQLVRWFK